MNNISFIDLLTASWETIYMVYIASLVTAIAGGSLGLVLFLTQNNQRFANPLLHQILSFLINGMRSIPFIILMICILPLTRFFTGTTIGTNAAIVPLVCAAIPYFARISENAFTEIPTDLFELANALGVKTWQLIIKFIIPESAAVLIKGMTLTIISLIGYSAMAGAIGGGGLGELAINYGYQRFNVFVTFETVIILVVLVQLIQWAGDYLALKKRFLPAVFVISSLGVACFFSQLHFHIPTTELKVGVIAGWSEDILKEARRIAAEKYHLNIKIIPFNDYILPNSALAQKEIDANIFQHTPYLQEQIRAQHYNIIGVAKTFVYPLGFYSTKYHTLEELPNGALIAIPNDPSNQARALLLFAKYKLISLDSSASTHATIQNIKANPKKLRFKLLDAAQIPRVLQDSDLLAITNDFLALTGLDISNAIIKEGSDSLYANIIAIRKEDIKNSAIQSLITIMHSEEIKQATYKHFSKEAAIPAW